MPNSLGTKKPRKSKKFKAHKVKAMSDALLSCTAVFRSRAAEIGLEADAIAEAVDQNIGSLGQFGFSTAFIPGIAKLALLIHKFIRLLRP